MGQKIAKLGKIAEKCASTIIFPENVCSNWIVKFYWQKTGSVSSLEGGENVIKNYYFEKSASSRWKGHLKKNEDGNDASGN